MVCSPTSRIINYTNKIKEVTRIMTQKSALKYLLDLLILFLMIVLMAYSVTGNFLHELLGILLFALFATHCILNRKWYKGSFARMFSSKFSPDIRIWTITNYLTHLNFILLAVSSVLISNIISLNVSGYSTYAFFHNILAYSGLVLVSAHAGIHGAVILKNIGRATGLSEKNSIRTWAARFVALVIIALGIWSFADKVFKKPDTQQPSTAKSSSSAALTSAVTFYGTNTAASYFSKTDSNLNIQKLSMSFNETIGADETLDDFLGRLYCTGCHRQCSLLSPQCSRGVQNAAQAQSYYESYDFGTDESTTQQPSTQQQTQESTAQADQNDTTEQEDSSQQAENEQESTQTTPPTQSEEVESAVQNPDDDNLGKILFEYGTMSGAVLISTHYAMQYIRRKTRKK